MTATKTIFEAFVNVCAKIENVKRDTDGQVGNTRYKYATIDSVLAVVHPLLSENGLALAQYVDGDNLRSILIHKSGEQIEFGSYALGQIGKHQERGSAITYGRRYQICSIFGIAQEDDDGAAASGGVAAKHKVFKTAKMRTDWANMFTARLQNCGSLEDLRACWSEESDTLNLLRNSDDDYDGVTYDHLEKVKDNAKAGIQEAMAKYQ